MVFKVLLIVILVVIGREFVVKRRFVVNVFMVIVGYR